MLLPDKHITLAESIMGPSALVLSLLANATTFDALMERLEPLTASADWPAFHTAESVSLALAFLFTIGLVDVTVQGELYRCV